MIVGAENLHRCIPPFQYTGPLAALRNLSANLNAAQGWTAPHDFDPEILEIIAASHVECIGLRPALEAHRHRASDLKDEGLDHGELLEGGDK